MQCPPECLPLVLPMSWDSLCHAWTESNKYLRAKVWDSWDWKENLHDKVRRNGSLHLRRTDAI